MIQKRPRKPHSHILINSVSLQLITHLATTYNWIILETSLPNVCFVCWQHTFRNSTGGIRHSANRLPKYSSNRNAHGMSRNSWVYQANVTIGSFALKAFKSFPSEIRWVLWKWSHRNCPAFDCKYPMTSDPIKIFDSHSVCVYESVDVGSSQNRNTLHSQMTFCTRRM